MTDDQLLRYSRHILLQEIGVEGQERLLHAHALVIGAGGVERIVEITLNADEKAMFDKSVGAVRGLVTACKGIDQSLGK